MSMGFIQQFLHTFENMSPYEKMSTWRWCQYLGSLKLPWYPLVSEGTGSLGNDWLLLGPPGADPGIQGHPNSQSQAQMIQKLRSD